MYTIYTYVYAWIKQNHDPGVTSMVCLNGHGRIAADIMAKNIEVEPYKELRSTSKPSVWDATELECTPWNQGARDTVSCRGCATLHPDIKQARQHIQK